VKCAKAEFDVGKGILYSEGEVEITMNVPEDEQPNGRLMVIKSSGVQRGEQDRQSELRIAWRRFNSTGAMARRGRRLRSQYARAQSAQPGIHDLAGNRSRARFP
jgi:hypothetical protein